MEKQSTTALALPLDKKKSQKTLDLSLRIKSSASPEKAKRNSKWSTKSEIHLGYIN